jgi:hypothetical protein
MPEGGVVSGAAGAEDPWSTAAVVLGDQTAGGAQEASGASAGAVVHYYFPVQIEVLEPLPVDHEAITDQALQRLTQHLEGR